MTPAVTLALAMAALAPGAAAEWRYAAGSGTGTPDGPMALFGEAETMAFLVLRCDTGARTLDYEDIEATAFPGARPIRVEAGGQRWTGEERLDPPDGVVVARARVPLDHPVVGEIGRGAQPIRIVTADGAMDLPNHPAVRRVVAECRSKAGL